MEKDNPIHTELVIADSTVPPTDIAIAVGAEAELESTAADVVTEQQVLMGQSSAELIGALASTAGRPWALRAEAFDVLVNAMREGVVGSMGAFFDFDEDESDAVETIGDTAIIPLQGMITPAPSMLARMFGMGGGLMQFRSDLREAVKDDDVKRIVLDIDSPGGLIDQVPETASMIRQAREVKPITAVANVVAASAAYWLGSQAGEFIATPSGDVGSIGVMMMHVDSSEQLEQAGLNVTITKAGKYKAEGHQFAPLDPDATKARQRKCDAVYEMFVGDVGEGRGVPGSLVRDGYGQGRALLAQDAFDVGLVDEIATLEQIVGRKPDPEPEPEPVTAENEDREARDPRALLIDLL